MFNEYGGSLAVNVGHGLKAIKARPAAVEAGLVPQPGLRYLAVCG